MGQSTQRHIFLRADNNIPKGLFGFLEQRVVVETIYAISSPTPNVDFDIASVTSLARK